jgi:hypothetical protein
VDTYTLHSVPIPGDVDGDASLTPQEAATLLDIFDLPNGFCYFSIESFANVQQLISDNP